MFITIKSIKGEKTIHLLYPITGGSKEIAIVSIFQDNVTYEFGSDTVSVGAAKGDKVVPKQIYTSRELQGFLSGNVGLNSHLLQTKAIKKSNKLGALTEMNFCLNELNNSDNLIDGQPSNLLSSLNRSDYGDTILFEPRNLIKIIKLRNGIIDSLTLSITDQNGELVTDSLGTNVVLHVR